LKVLGVDPEPGFGGGESQVLGLTLELRGLGHRAELACAPGKALWQKATAAGIVCHPLAMRNALDLSATLRLRRLVAKGMFDVVHLHTARAHALAPYLKGRGAVLVVTRRMDYRPNRLFAPWLYGRAVDAAIAISAGVARALTEAGVSPAALTVIASGVDCRRFHPPDEEERRRARAALGVEDQAVVIGAVGALEPRKGHRWLLEALALLARRPQAAAQRAQALCCKIVGEGSLCATLAAQARRLGLDAAVGFMGRVDDTAPLLHAFDLLVLPSLKEGLGVALLEAMASGLPAVASRVGGVCEAVEPGRTGLLVEPGDAYALAQAIERLAADGPGRRAMGRQARLRAEQLFSIQESARRTLEVYARCLNARAGKSGEMAYRCKA
jgi:glycosyltransferase involved in cell wall biosynthesis